MLNNKKCSLLIHTCDDYEDTLIPFFSLLSNYFLGGAVQDIFKYKRKKYIV